MINVNERFSDLNDENFLKFEKIDNKLHHRKDICAFLYLDRMLPSANDIIGGACHDQIYFDVDDDALAQIATDDDVIYLLRCGVFWSTDVDGLAMFV
jgi:hypothetical protein